MPPNIAGRPSNRTTPELEAAETNVKAYHVDLLKETGLIDALISNDERGNPARWNIKRLTWEGHDFLDVARDPVLWDKAREKFLKPAVSWTFGLVVEWLKAEAKAKLGLH